MIEAIKIKKMMENPHISPSKLSKIVGLPEKVVRNFRRISKNRKIV